MTFIAGKSVKVLSLKTLRVVAATLQQTVSYVGTTVLLTTLALCYRVPQGLGVRRIDIQDADGAA